VRGCNVGTRLDLAEAVAFAANGLVTAKIKKAPLERISEIFDEMRAGRILGRMVLKMA
jgi:alcohol dehydrogenase, propanol-preferring